VQILSPLPGSRVWRLAEEKGLVSNEMDFDTLWNWDPRTALEQPDSFPYLNDEVPRGAFLGIYRKFVEYRDRRGGYEDSLSSLLTSDRGTWRRVAKHPFLLRLAARRSLVALARRFPLLRTILRRLRSVFRTLAGSRD
jgi:hypothetical protein